MQCIDSTMLLTVIKDKVVHINLSLTKILGQCCDGTTNMSRVRNVIAKQLQEVETLAIYLHCCGRSFN